MINESFYHQGGWDSLNQSQNNVIFSISIIAAILHFLLWCQIFIYKIKFNITILFSLGYISTDIFLLLSYFIQYGIRIRPWISITRLFCYFEAYSMFYFNLFESFCLTALNICRYHQIVRNDNIYIVHRRKLIASFIIILLFILINFIIEDVFHWCFVIEKSGSSCTLTYTNIIVRIWNISIVLLTPIIINFYMLFLSIHYLQNVNAQQMIMRRNHHHRLILHSFIFYSIWLTLWLPLVMIIYLDISSIDESIKFIVLVTNTLEILIDPIIALFVDKRFAKVWKKSCQWITHKVDCMVVARVHPTIQVETIRQTNTINHTPD